MPSLDHFLLELRAQMQRAIKRGAKQMIVNAAELHQAVGDYIGPNQRMNYCCEAMKDLMGPEDTIITDPTTGAELTILYRLPQV